MLVPKEIKRKKLILYIFIIGLMLGGTGILLYKNYTLTSSKEILIMDTPAEIADIDLAETGNEGTKKDSDLIPKAELPDKEIIDLSLLDSPKFKNLKETFIETINFDIGKRNPFEPY